MKTVGRDIWEGDEYQHIWAGPGRACSGVWYAAETPRGPFQVKLVAAGLASVDRPELEL